MGKVLTFAAVFAAGLLLMEPTPKVVAQAEPVVVVPVKPDETKPDIVEKIASQAPAAKDYGCDTYPIRARGYTADRTPAFPSGSCVSVGNGQFFTAAHIFAGLQAGYVCEIQIADEGHKTTALTIDTKADVAQAVIAKNALPGVKVRPVEFGEAVTIYGLTTCEAQRGVYVGDSHVGLETSARGVDFGDSGGGVYGEDGALVGLISAFGDDRRSVFVSVIGKVETVQAETPKAAPQPQSSCPGGVCPRPMQVQPQQRRGWFRGR